MGPKSPALLGLRKPYKSPSGPGAEVADLLFKIVLMSRGRTTSILNWLLTSAVERKGNHFRRSRATGFADPYVWIIRVCIISIERKINYNLIQGNFSALTSKYPKIHVMNFFLVLHRLGLFLFCLDFLDFIVGFKSFFFLLIFKRFPIIRCSLFYQGLSF